MRPRATESPLFPYTTLFPSGGGSGCGADRGGERTLPPLHGRCHDTPTNDHDRTHRTGGSSARANRSWACRDIRSEEHTSELQSLRHLVCRLLLEKKKRTSAT